MRVLHTADWHMNDRLGREDRSGDISRSLRRIAEYLREGEADVMVVAGDLFSELSSREQMRDAIGELRTTFTPFLRGGGTIVAISGNHDNVVFFEMMRNALGLVTPLTGGGRGQNGAGVQPAGRFYFAPTARVLPLADRRGNVVQFVLMPYPTTRYLRGEAQKWKNIEERHRAIQAKYKEVLDSLSNESNFDKRLPSVLVSHVHVRGSEIHSLFRISEMESIIFEPGDIPAGWAYAAYGHIHKPQKIGGADHVRYCGSIERFDAGEQNDDKQVVLFEVGPSGLIVPPQELPLDSTPIRHVEITDPERDIPRLAELCPNADRALVKYTLHWDPHLHNRDDLCRDIERHFPRWYDREFRIIGADAQAERAWTAERMQDVTTTVRAYLEERLAGNARRDELLALADQLLAEEGHR
jgi:DNA repair exonuclease SbcCD nuclease subunit